MHDFGIGFEYLGVGIDHVSGRFILMQGTIYIWFATFCLVCFGNWFSILPSFLLVDTACVLHAIMCLHFKPSS